MSGCVLDTDVVIGALDRDDAHHPEASAALMWMLDHDVQLFLCVVNYAEALVKPAEAHDTLQRATDAIASLRIKLYAPDAAIARDGARLRGLNISLADGFALATARALGASIASYDVRVRAAAGRTGVPLA